VFAQIQCPAGCKNRAVDPANFSLNAGTTNGAAGSMVPPHFKLVAGKGQEALVPSSAISRPMVSALLSEFLA